MTTILAIYVINFLKCFTKKVLPFKIQSFLRFYNYYLYYFYTNNYISAKRVRLKKFHLHQTRQHDLKQIDRIKKTTMKQDQIK